MLKKLIFSNITCLHANRFRSVKIQPNDSDVHIAWRNGVLNNIVGTHRLNNIDRYFVIFTTGNPWEWPVTNKRTELVRSTGYNLIIDLPLNGMTLK